MSFDELFSGKTPDEVDRLVRLIEEEGLLEEFLVKVNEIEQMIEDFGEGEEDTEALEEDLETWMSQQAKKYGITSQGLETLFDTLEQGMNWRQVVSIQQ